MGELVEQLRYAAKRLKGWSETILRTQAEQVTGGALLYDQAADEIERLRADLDSETRWAATYHAELETLKRGIEAIDHMHRVNSGYISRDIDGRWYVYTPDGCCNDDGRGSRDQHHSLKMTQHGYCSGAGLRLRSV